MNDENGLPEQQHDDDLLSWTPPELVERARYTAEKDAQSAAFVPKKKRLDFSKPPAGKNKTLALLMLIGVVFLLVLSTVLAASGTNGQQAVLERGRAWYFLWIVGQAASLCIYMLFLLPLGSDMRRPALFTLIGADLLSKLGAAMVALLQEKNTSMAGTAAVMVLRLLFMLAFTPSVWLLFGLIRRKTTERMAAVMGCVYLFIQLFVLLSKLSGSTGYPPIYVSLMDFVRSGLYMVLLFNWPILTRPVLAAAAPDQIEKPIETEGEKNNEQSE